MSSNVGLRIAGYRVRHDIAYRTGLGYVRWRECSSIVMMGLGIAISGCCIQPPPPVNTNSAPPKFQDDIGSSYFRITQIADVKNPGNETFWANPDPMTQWTSGNGESQTSLPLAASTQPSVYANTYNHKSSSCLSTVGVYVYTDPSSYNMEVRLLPGTGTAQSNNGDFTSDSETEIKINAQWTVKGTGTIFPHPNDDPIYDYGVSGVVSGGGCVEVIIKIKYWDVDKSGNATPVGDAVDIDKTYTSSGKWDGDPFQGTDPLKGHAFMDGNTFRITETMKFRAFGSTSSVLRDQS